MLQNIAYDVEMVEVCLDWVVILWLADQISVEWEEESILLRLCSELRLAVDRTPRMMHVDFATPLIVLF